MTKQAPMFSGKLAWASNFDTTTPFWVPALNFHAASGEHGFNALKTTDAGEQARVLAAPTPKGSKAIGRRVTLRPGWDTGVRVAAMSHVLKAKFSVPQLEQNLLATGELLLVETNYWHDQFWGDCTCAKHVGIPGTNMLGQLLMAIRAAKRGL